MPAKKKYPKEDPNFDWVTSQAPRHEAAQEFYGGTKVTFTEGAGAHRLLNPLYTSQTAKEAVEYAMQANSAGGKDKPSSQQAKGTGTGGQKKKKTGWKQRAKGFHTCRQFFCRCACLGSSSRASSRSATLSSLLEDQCRLNGQSQT